MGRFARRDLDLELTFEHVDGDPLVGRLASIALFVEDETPPLAVFTLSLSLSTYLRVEDEQLFGVSFATTAPGQGPVIFWDTAPVELEVTLLPELAARWLEVGEGSLEDTLDRLVLGFDDHAPELLDARSYLWHRALQIQPSGPDATIKQGLRSVFA